MALYQQKTPDFAYLQQLIAGWKAKFGLSNNSTDSAFKITMNKRYRIAIFLKPAYVKKTVRQTIEHEVGTEGNRLDCHLVRHIVRWALFAKPQTKWPRNRIVENYLRGLSYEERRLTFVCTRYGTMAIPHKQTDSWSDKSFLIETYWYSAPATSLARDKGPTDEGWPGLHCSGLMSGEWKIGDQTGRWLYYDEDGLVLSDLDGIKARVKKLAEGYKEKDDVGIMGSASDKIWANPYDTFFHSIT